MPRRLRGNATKSEAAVRFLRKRGRGSVRLPSIISDGQLAAMAHLASTMPQGDFVEVGVYQGGSAGRLYEVAMRQGRKLHLFDTFTGTPFHVPGLDIHKKDKEFAAETTPMIISHAMPEANLYIGIYPDTHPKGLGHIAFVHCDCDQYESYRAVIHNMWPLLVVGGALLFDDYPYLPGAKRAVEEAFPVESLQKCGGRFYVTKSD